MFFADSRFIIDVLEGEPGALRQAEQLRWAGTPDLLPAPVAPEVLIGGSTRGRYLVKAEELIDGLETVSVDRESAREAALIGFQTR